MKKLNLQEDPFDGNTIKLIWANNFTSWRQISNIYHITFYTLVLFRNDLSFSKSISILLVYLLIKHTFSYYNDFEMIYFPVLCVTVFFLSKNSTQYMGHKLGNFPLFPRFCFTKMDMSFLYTVIANYFFLLDIIVLYDMKIQSMIK